MPSRYDSRGLSRTSRTLLWAGLAVAIVHHADHVMRVDHSGWPFRPQVTPFTYSLLAYPMILFALWGPLKLFWWRWTLLLAGTAFTLLAHSMIESPAMQYTMWAHDRSLDPGTVGAHNLLAVQSGLIGWTSVTVSMVLNCVATASTLSMLVDGVRQRRGSVCGA